MVKPIAAKKVAIRTMLAKRYMFMRKKVVTAIALSIFFVVISRNLTSNSSNANNPSNNIDNLLISPAEAVQLRDRKTYFVQLPTLLEAETTTDRTYASGATYYFAIAIPQNMGEPLQKLEISQAEGFESIDFIRDDTIAYLEAGTGDRMAIPIKAEILLGQDQSQKKIIITFDPPILANSKLNRKLIVGLRPSRNPRYDGVYLFGVTASPQGDRPNPQFIGYGRLHFYSSRY